MALQVDWDVLLDWSEALQAIIRGGNLDVFEAYSETAAAVAHQSLALYVGYLKGMPLPNGAAIQHPSGNLARHAELQSTGGPLDLVLHNDSPYAEAVETGTKARDMKEMLATAPKARRAKDGSLYLILPFRHGTQGTVGLKPMPPRIQAMAQNLKRSAVTGNRLEASATRPGAMVQRNTYQWGQKLTVAQIIKAGGSFKDQNRYAGMHKFGAQGHTSYITFRVMSSKSTGWILPARPGLFPAKSAVEEAMKEGLPLLSEALLEDLFRLAGI